MPTKDHCVDDDGDVANGQKLNSAKHLFQTVGKLILKTFLLENQNQVQRVSCFSVVKVKITCCPTGQITPSPHKQS